MDERNPLNSMPFFPTEQDWTLVSRPIRIPLEERFPAAYAVNSLPYSTAKPPGGPPQRRAAAIRAAKVPRDNPNNIPLPSKNDRTQKEAGEITDQVQEGDPSWLREPAAPTHQFFNKKGEPIEKPEGWD